MQMPLQIMDPSKNEGNSKLLKGKKKEGPKEKSITDFFKTPEKEIIVKQKSLLQFFGKPASTAAQKRNENSTDAIECTDTDKENITKSIKQEPKGESKDLVHEKLELVEIPTKDVDSEKVDAKVKEDCSVKLCSEQEGIKKKNDEKLDQNEDCKNEVEGNLHENEAKNIHIIDDDDDDDIETNVENINRSEKINGEIENHDQEPVVEIDKGQAIPDLNNQQDNVKDGNTCRDAEDTVPRVSKRNNLKVKDMLDLLKEVQGCERTEKKKKSKHKLHKHKSKDTHEVHKGESGMIVSTNKEKDDENCIEIDSEHSSEPIEDHSNKTDETNNTNGSEIVKKKEKTNTKQLKKVNKKVEDIENDKVEKNNTNKSEISKKKRGVANTREIKKVKKKVEENKEASEAPNEMSYTDFLAKLSQNNTEEMEVDVVDVEESEQMVDSVNDEDGAISDVKLMKQESDQMITNFFNFTSTPGKDSINKKAKKAKQLKDDSKKEEIDKGVNNEKKEKKKGVKKKKDNITGKNEETCDQSKEGVSNSEENKARKSDFLQSKVSIPSKTTQATLSFGSDGFKISKQNVPVDSSKDQKVKSVKNSKAAVKNNVETNSEIPELNLSTLSESAFLTPKPKKTKKRKVPATADLSTDLDESDLTDNSEGKRRSLRKKYKVTVFQMDEERKTPIKIKLRRCAKSSSTENEDQEKIAEEKITKAKANVKHTKALALLEKAKNRIHKTKLRKKGDKEALKPCNKPVEKLKRLTNKKDQKEKPKKATKKKRHESEEGNARRSSRLEGKSKVSMEEVSIDNIVISSSDEDEPSKPVKKKKKKGESTDVVKSKDSSTPVKGGKGKSPVKKSGAKLAPMFLMGKKKAVDSPVKPVLNPEQAKQRQMFLMSGIPDELKKQTAIRQANTLVETYPPIPTVNHVQQIHEVTDVESSLKDINVWRLGKVDLKLKEDGLQAPVLKSKFTGCLVSKIKETTLQKLDKPKALDESTVEKCLNEIMAFNPSYPVKAMYKAFKESKLYGEGGQNKNDSQEMRTDMKGILSDLGKTETEPKKGKRKSLKLNKKETETEKEEEKPAPIESACTGSSLLWTDKYYPAKASEILGNGGSLKKLKDWLLEWKQVLEKEAKRARKLLLKKKKGKASSVKDNKDSDFDSDFDMDSDDSDDDMSLCNTTLLVGPHGAGKTSSVYALAQELGYKVHEVNASSSRSGRQILSQLQEATQSHQVSSQGCHTPSKKKGLIDKVHDSTTEPKSKMSLFTNLLQKQPTTGANKSDVEGSKKNKKHKPEKGDKAQKGVKDAPPKNVRNKQMAALISEDSNSQSITPSINLSRTTLILFEEVDVAFEEDKGFLTAVQTFMSTTKIPIILTSTKRSFSPSFEGRFEVINIKKPSVAAVSSHLQTMALTENMRTDFGKLCELVKMYDCDVRRCLLMLQYLIESGGTHDNAYRVLKDVSIVEKKLESQPIVTVEKPSEVLSNLNEEKSDDDLDDFIVLKGRQNKRRRILEDADSNLCDISTDKVLRVSVIEEAGIEEAKKCPLVYGLGLKCFLQGLLSCRQGSIVECIKQYLQKEASLPLEDLTEICRTFSGLTRSSLLYNNMHLLLPLSLCVKDNITQLPKLRECAKKKGKKRKRIMSDLYDSEGSDNEEICNDTITESKTPTKDCNNTEPPVDDCNKLQENTIRPDNSHVIKSLCSFASFYDTMAMLDVMRTCSDMRVQDRVCSLGSIKPQTVLPPGLEDDLCNFTNDTDLESTTTHDIEACIETRAFCKLSRCVQCCRDGIEGSADTNSDLMDQLTLPVSPGMDELQMRDTVSYSTSPEVQRAMNDIKDNLPYTLTKNMRCINVDYLPTLREICRCESTRLTANTKRRFHHYFDNITLPLRDKTMNILASTLT